MIPSRYHMLIILFFLLLIPLVLTICLFPTFGVVGHPVRWFFFSLQLLLDRFSSRENLFNRKVIVDIGLIICPFNYDYVESVSHQFVTCDLDNTIQYMIFSCLGWHLFLPNDPILFFESFLSLGGRVKSRDFFLWSAMQWCWLFRRICHAMVLTI